MKPVMTEGPSRAYGQLQREFCLLVDEPMACHTSFKVGGPADLFFAPATKEELIRGITRAKGLDIPVTVLGCGTNLLVKDSGIRGLVVTTQRMNKTLAIDKTEEPGQVGSDQFITASSGVILATLARFAMDRGVEGFTFCAGIPGTVGGAVMMNAGTTLGTISDVLVSLELFAGDGRVRMVDRSELGFSHRRTSFKTPGPWVFILGARFQVRAGNKKEIRARWLSLLEKRRTSQPESMASAGCFFKNPDTGKPAGWLIEQAGLKGKKFGNAMVSKTHANFIVNRGGATAMEILALKQIIEDEVKKKFNVDLKPEVKIEGE